MEIKINLLNLEDAKNALTNLESSLTEADSVSDIITLIQNSSGETNDEINEAYRALKRVEVSLAKLIQTTQIVVSNTKTLANNTDTGIAQVFENTYSNYDTGVFAKK